MSQLEPTAIVLLTQIMYGYKVVYCHVQRIEVGVIRRKPVLTYASIVCNMLASVNI